MWRISMKDVTVDQLEVGEMGLYGDIKLQAMPRTENVCLDCHFVHESCVFVKCDSGKIIFKKVE